MTKLEFDEGSLSAVIGLYTIIHFKCEEQIQMIANISRWLKPGGRLLMNFEPEPIEGEAWGTWLDEKGHILQ